MRSFTAPMIRAAGAALGVAGMLLAVSAAHAETTLERIKRTGEIKIGFANEAPYGYQTPEGELTGEAPEVAEHILKEMGVTKIQPVLAEFGALIPGLKAGRFDMIAAGMYITPPRCKQILFSEPSYSIGETFAVKAGNPKKLDSYEAVAKDSSVKLGVMAGAVESGYARQMGISQSQLVVFPDGPSALSGVRSGRVDAYAGTDLTISDLLSKNGEGLEKAAPFKDPVIDGEPVRGYGAFGFRPDDKDFHSAFNEKLVQFRGSPEHLKVVEPFGFGADNMPKKTTVELCKS